LLCLAIAFCAMNFPAWSETIPAEKLWGWPKGWGSPWNNPSCPAATYEFITKDKFGCAPIAEQCHPNRGQAGYSPFYGTENCGIYTADNRVAGGGTGWTVCPQGFSLDSGGATCSRPNNCSATQFRNDSGECISLPPAVETGSISEAKSCQRDDGLQVGKPIIPATGEKILDELDIAGSGPDALSLSRHYGSSRVVGPVTGSIAAGLGKPWSHNHATFLKQEGISGIAGSMARVLFGDGSVRGFNWNTASNSWKPANSADILSSNATGLQYRRLDDDSVWQFDTTGKLLTVTQRNGWVRTHTYSTAGTSAGLLIGVTNHFGRSLSFQYNAAGQLSSVITPDGRVISYGYDSTAATARLTTVNYPGVAGGTVSKTYLYENTTFPQLLTGIIDEKGSRLATYAYDGQGRGVSTQYAGGAGLHSISYGTGGSATVTDPLGTQRTYSYGIAQGKLVVTGADKPSGSGNSSAASRVQDADGFVTQETDFLGVTTMYTWDINRRLPLTTTQAAALPDARTTTTQWHTSYRLPVTVTEPGNTRSYTYDSVGNALTQTVTDIASSISRTTAWTYNPQGLVATERDPNGVVARSYAYYATSSFTPAPVPSSIDPNFQSVSLLLHGDGTNGSTAIVDSSPRPKPVTAVGGVSIGTAQSKFGGSSLFFDGVDASNTAITLADSPDFHFPGAYTVEFWIRPLSSKSVTSWLYVQSDQVGTPAPVRIDFASSTGLVNILGSSDNTSWLFTSGLSSTTALQLGAWGHVALADDGTMARLFVNGLLQASRATWPKTDPSSPLRIGGAYTGGDREFNGNLDDLRVTKGLARYTANFTPPSQAFPNAAPSVPVINPDDIGYTAGDLQSITNAAGHVTQFTQYDRAGRVRQMVDPKGIVTGIAYTPRGWLSSVTLTPPGGAARTTSYIYDNAGQLTGATLPDGTTLGYSYDAAHRLTSVTDAKGNTITYTLDAAGNRTGEQVKDSSNTLQRNITRVYDALNRVQQVTGASN